MLKQRKVGSEINNHSKTRGGKVGEGGGSFGGGGGGGGGHGRN